jgi:TolB-like protein/tetratricopeptide (TPR) repeat protein
MPDNSDNPTNFWQELKRRKVVKVIIMYAVAAYVIIELCGNVVEPLSLPEWTPTLIIVLLVIGFPFAVIFSWIFDITPKGIVKTEPAKVAKKKNSELKPAKRRLKVSDVIIAVMVVVVSILLYPKIFKKGDVIELEKSIAVLPFRSLSDDPDKQYLADGVMDAILLHLSKIEELRVMSRTSVEQYRDTDKTVTEICEELDVAFLLEGNFRKYGDQARLIVQLIQPGKEDHVWANKYDREWKDIFAVESEVAQSIAAELQAVITPEEKQLIEKIPTTNLTAYDFYQRGRAEYEDYWQGIAGREALERAEDLYRKALECDSTYALAYTGLARVYWNMHYYDTYLTENFLDSVLILADMALLFDDQLSEAFVVKGNYYQANNKNEQAVIEYDRAIQYNPNDWMAYYGKGQLHLDEDDYKNSIEYYYKAASLYRGPLLPMIYRDLAFTLVWAGFRELGLKFAKEAIALDDDSASYYRLLATSESNNSNFEKSIEFFERSLAIDSTRPRSYLLMGNNYCFLGQFEKALSCYKKAYDSRRDIPEHLSSFIMIRLGQTYLNLGKEEEATYYLNRARDLEIEREKLGRIGQNETQKYHGHAGMFACMGEKDKAFENLRLLSQIQHIPVWIVIQLKVDPLFNSIRDEPEFQQIVRDIETKYQAEHERVRQWLEENDML